MNKKNKQKNFYKLILMKNKKMMKWGMKTKIPKLKMMINRYNIMLKTNWMKYKLIKHKARKNQTKIKSMKNKMTRYNLSSKYKIMKMSSKIIDYVLKASPYYYSK